MIGWLQGVVIEKELPNHLVVNVGGVGYELQVPLPLLADAVLQGPLVAFYTHLAIREDAHQLYGFNHKFERDFFRQLIRINGIGPKLALSILSAISLERLVRALAEKDVAQLVELPGIGKKMAERLVMESAGFISAWVGYIPQAVTPVLPHMSDAIAALIHLGYKPKEATQLIERLQREHNDWDRETLLRQALKVLAPV